MKKKKWIALVMTILASFTSVEASENIIYDYIIVGNGTAGAVLARKLTDSLKKKVLVLEAGINQNNDPAVLDTSGVQLLDDLTSLTYNPKYAQTYSVAVFNPLQSIVYSEGRGWGGSSKHNYLQVIRGTPDIYNAWATISGNPLWSYNNLLPMMLALENYTPCGTTANPAERGVGGPISVTQTPSVTMDPLGMLLASGTGAGFIPDINDPTEMSTTGHAYLGFSAFQMFATATSPCVTGHRSFSSNSFLPSSIISADGKAVGKRLLRIESNTYVNNIIFDGDKAVGVKFLSNNNPSKALKAYGKKIILCAGSVNSPAILQRSGIGDPAVLKPLGIKVRVNNPNVGANLLNQYGVNAVIMGTSTNATPFLQGFISGTGLTENPFIYPNDNTRRIQFDAFQAGPYVQIIGFLLDPKSRGTVQIVSTNPLVPPNINLNMYSDGGVETNGTDANLGVAAYYLIAKSVGSGNMVFPPASLFTQPPGTTYQDEALLAQAQTASGVTAESHIVATTQMGTSIANGVVDGNLHVFGVKNLMVVDAGVIPVLPNGNICYGVYMIALGACAILGVPTPPAL